MNISQVGIDLIKKFEGVILHEYKDAVGVPTIGYGHTGGVAPDQRITQAEAENLLRHDLDRFEDAVAKLVNVPINQYQFDALVSFSFNVGSGALAKSTLLKKLNAKDYQGAADEFLKWNKAGGNVLAGLTARRKAERQLFLKPIPVPTYPGHTLEKGDADHKNVAVFQKYLHIEADGIFGDGTKAAVIKFQKAHGLTADGVVGPKTWSLIVK